MVEINRIGQQRVGPGEQRPAGDVRFVSAPAPHAGVGRALRESFASLSKLPDEWARMLDRLR